MFLDLAKYIPPSPRKAGLTTCIKSGLNISNFLLIQIYFQISLDNYSGTQSSSPEDLVPQLRNKPIF